MTKIIEYIISKKLWKLTGKEKILRIITYYIYTYRDQYGATDYVKHFEYGIQKAAPHRIVQGK